MGLAVAQVAVTAATSPELTVATDEADSRGGQSIAILDCDVDLYLGPDAAVTAGTGAKLPAHTPFAADLAHGERLFARGAAAGTAQVVRTGV
jgi:hypothetical protein